MAVSLFDARAPEGMRVYAIGDVHGRRDLLEAMHGAIAAEIERDRPGQWRIVHLGDYVDRGPEACGVLDFLAALRGDPSMVMLAGNHDLAMLDFLARPQESGLFARFGGDRTLASYGVTPRLDTPGASRDSRDALLKAMPPAHLELLRGLELSAGFGDYFFCHAGIRPGVPLERQDTQDLVWIRDEFLEDARLHPKVIVHGHTPFDEPQLRPNRVDVDTRAFASGVLTAFVAEGAHKRLLSVADAGRGAVSATVR